MSREIDQWLARVGLAKYSGLFAEHEIDLDVLSDLTEADLKDLGFPLGDRKRLLKAISSPSAELADGATREAGSAQSQEAERRQLTVMFCDLVGSTAISARLDPEDMRNLLRAYQDTCAAVIDRYEGYVAKFMGDGVYAYFGYPRAHEDDAERAISASLETVDAIKSMSAGAGENLDMAVRIGIATGLVAVGDLIGDGASEEAAVVGEAPNLAARLQALAEPDAVVISGATHSLAGGLFDCADFGSHSLKGFADPVRAWIVKRRRQVETRFDATRDGQLIELTGREEELEILLRRWQRAKASEAQIALVTGEPGIGKSRLAREFRIKIMDERHRTMRYQCSPYHTNSALHPVIKYMELAAGFGASDTPDTKLAKLRSLLSPTGQQGEDAESLIASLFSLPVDDHNTAPSISPRQRKELTLLALVKWFAKVAEQDPVLFVFEDAHWIDPTTLEMLEMTVERLGELPILMIITYRPEFDAPWVGAPNATLLALSRLNRRERMIMAERVAQGRAFPESVLEQIVARTDGVPLFVEEITKSVLETADADLPAGPGRPTDHAIPQTLYDALEARLDRLGPAKEIAQIGAVVGRQFSYRVIDAVAQCDRKELAYRLDRLAASDLVTSQGAPPDATYTFKHSLVQDTAYMSLLRDKRRDLHRRISDVLREQPSNGAEPELIAHHLTEAGAIKMAIPYWHKAGQQAAERSADKEAAQHLRKALQLLEDTPEGAPRWEQELETLIVLGPVLMNLKGSASTEVRDAYVRARDLCDQVGQSAQQFPVLWGLWLHHFVAGELTTAARLAGESIELAGALSNQDFLLQAHHAAWSSYAGLADFALAVEHADQGLAIYDMERHRAHAFIYGGHDVGVCAAAHSANVIWILGYPNEALSRCDKALELARAVGHSFSTAQALATAALTHLLRREPRQSVAISDELITFSSDNGLTLWKANGQILRSWARSETGNASQALDDFRTALEQRKSAGSQVRQSLHLAAMAHCLARTGEVGEAENVIAEALDQMAETGERIWESFVHWVRGQVVALIPDVGRERASACYEDALKIARQQRAKSMELRAATSLAGILWEEGRTDEARNLLAPVYGWFTEGFDTPDLIDAKALLDRLA